MNEPTQFLAIPDLSKAHTYDCQDMKACSGCFDIDNPPPPIKLADLGVPDHTVEYCPDTYVFDDGMGCACVLPKGHGGPHEDLDRTIWTNR